MLRWYLIHTKPLNEGLARTNLERQEYQVYLPRATQSVRCQGHWRERIVALFPRYLFLRLHEGRQSLAPVRSTLGVASVVRFGSQYTIVPDEVIEVLMARADGATGLHRLVRPSRLMPGTPVCIHKGPFDGLAGVFEREAGADRVVVLLDLLGHAVSAHVREDSVMPQLVV
jgi:transcriptional antiterminator RfaH